MPIVAFVVTYLVLDKIGQPKDDFQRLYIANYTASGIYTAIGFYWLLPALSARLWMDSPTALLQECDIITFSIVLYSIHFCAMGLFQWRTDARIKDGVMYVIGLLGYAAFDTYAALYLKLDLFFVHVIALVWCLVQFVGHAYQFFFWITDRKRHDNILISAMRYIEFFAWTSPIVVAIRNTEENTPILAHVYVYAVAVAIYWQYACIFAYVDYDDDTSNVVGFTRPVKGMSAMPTYLLLPSKSYMTMLTNGEVAPPAPSAEVPAVPEPVPVPDTTSEVDSTEEEPASDLAGNTSETRPKKKRRNKNKKPGMSVL